MQREKSTAPVRSKFTDLENIHRVGQREKHGVFAVPPTDLCVRSAAVESELDRFFETHVQSCMLPSQSTEPGRVSIGTQSSERKHGKPHHCHANRVVLDPRIANHAESSYEPECHGDDG